MRHSVSAGGHAVHGRGHDSGHNHQSARYSVAHDHRPLDRVHPGQGVGEQGRDRRRDALQRRGQRPEDLDPAHGVRLSVARQ